MNSDFTDYLTEIEMPGPLIERVEYFHNLYTDLIRSEPERVFVSDLIQEDGSRSYDSLWFFTGSEVMEAHRFLDAESFDLDSASKITYWRVEKESYTVGSATAASRMRFVFSTEGGSTGDLKATGSNCDRLWTLMKEWFVPKSIAAP
ncbi:MAG: hypothetical protein KJ698_05065 [Actinobacteria bacterium]|nr:hypothetical protein [Actinomycetota bacterium]MBU1494572.1 hypothetical protein [Actinomycetota bacterium]MBU1864880.1 hypothetical protein [Actinomycetota bacterium]